MRIRVRSALVVILAIAMTASVVTVIDPPAAQAQDAVLGGQLFSNGGVNEVTILGGTAGITSTLWLVSPEEIEIGTNREVGKVVNIGPFDAGDELIFAIRYNNIEFQTGPAERNPDGIVHNSVVYGDDVTTVGFEDLLNGGDRDYDDNNWSFTNVLQAPPELAIDAGPDQTVPEGSVVTLNATATVSTEAPLPEQRTDAVTFRDWSVSNPDYAFNHPITSENGIVEDDLGADRKPVYASPDRTITTTGADNFEAWYNDVAGVNERFEKELVLELRDVNASPVYRHEDLNFLPLSNDEGFGTEGQGSNFNFTTEYHTSFRYGGGEVLQFRADNDMWVFINGKLAVDIGGTAVRTASVDLDAVAADLGIEIDGTYNFDLFHAERGPTGSGLTFEVPAPSTVSDAEVEWSLISSSGAPINVLGLDTLTPTFQALDDGEYVFRATVTDGDQVETDDVTVTVENVAPVVGSAAAPTTEDGLIMVSSSITDVGILDTHSATIDWGDGSTPTDVPASAQGSGWASIAGAHAYDAPGSYDITVTVFDDDGAETASSVSLVEVGGSGVPQPEAGVALWGDSSSDNRPVWLTGSGHQVFGLTHSNRDLRVNGSNHSFTGESEYVRKLDNKSNSTVFSSDPVEVSVADRPIEFPIEDYEPGGASAVAAGDQYFDMSDACGTKKNAKWKPSGVLEPGLYWVPCEVDITGTSFATGPLTIASPEEISVSGGSKDFLAPFIDSALFISDSTSSRAIAIAGGSGTYAGYISANRGDIAISGSGHVFDCGILGDTIKISGSNHTVDAGRCGLADTAGSLSDGVEVTAPPLIVPDLNTTATAPTEAAPAQAFDVVVTTSNDGATVVVPGLVALSNGSSSAVTVDSATYELEIFDTNDGWITLASSVDAGATLVGADAGNADVSYPADSSVVGTEIPSGSAGVWAITGTIELDDAQIARVLDPAQTEAVRSRVTLTTAGNVLAVRQTTRFGGNILDALTTAGAGVDDIDANLITNTSGSQTEAVGSLQPGEDVDATFAQIAGTAGLKDVGESDADYLTRLQVLDASVLAGVASAQGTSTIGSIYTAGQPVVTNIDLPILRLTASPTSARPGEDAVWMLAISNTGDAAATGVTLVATADGVALTVPAIADIAPNSAEVVEIAVPVAAGAQDIDVAASLTWQDAAGNDYGTIDASATAREIQPADLEVLKLVVLSETAVNTLTYIITVSNTGDADDLTGVVLSDQIDPNAELVVGSVTNTIGSVTSGNSAGDTDVAVDISTLGPNATAIISFDVDVANRPPGVTSISNQASVSSNELPDVLSDEANLPGPADTTVFDLGGGTTPGGDPVIIGVGDIDGPVASDFVPASSSLVTEPVEITATITTTDGAAVTAWETTLFPSGSDPAEGTVIASGTGTPTLLGEVDPTVLRNGPYTILFTATDDQGRTRLSETNVIVDGFLKLGRYSTTYLDSQVTVGGIPLQVLRTYDTLDRGEVGDFGYGWNLDVGNFRVYTNRALGLGAWTSTGCGPGLIFQDICFTSDPANVVTVEWPDGNTESFDLAPKGNTFFPIQATVGYEPRDRATSTLTPVGNTTIGLNGNDGHFHNGGFGDGAIYNPSQFLLTAKDGSTYLLDKTVGLIQATDRDGNTVTINDDGIVSSLGPAMTFTRDAEGRITTLTEPDGDTVTYSYDANGDLTGVTDQKGAESTFGYDADHYLTEIDDPTGAQRTLTYDDDGRLTGITDANGNTTQVLVDPDARTEIVTDPDGNLTTVSSFDERGNALTVDEIYDGASHLTTFTYDGDDQVTSRTDPEGNTWAASYDVDENLTQFVDAEGNTSNFTYDDFGFPLTVTDADGETTTFTYDTAGNIASIIDARGGVQLFTYDAQGNQITRTDQVGRTWEWTYTAESRLATSTDPRGNTTSYTYDANGQVETMTAADGGVTSYVYDGVGNLTETSDPLNRSTTYTYDGRDLLTSVEDPSGATTTYTYDGVGRVLTRQDPTNREWSYTYAFDRLDTETAPDGGVTAYSYDGAGRVSQMTDPLNRVTSYSYDGAHRRTQVTSPIDDGGIATSITGYDGNGRVTAATNAESEATSYVYDTLGRLESMTDPIGRTTSYGYDATGNRTGVTNAEAETTAWVYDLAGQLESVTNAEAESTAYTYDLAGNMATVTDPLNRVTAYGYDDVNRRTSMTLPSGDSSGTVFDLAGQVTESTSPAGITATFDYDARGLVSQITDELGNSQSSAYDPAGRLLTATDARSNDTTFTYDANGRLESETDPLGGSVVFDYDLAGQRVGLTDPNTATRTFGYDDGGRMTTATDAENRETSYVYDAVGRRTEMTDARGITITSTFDDAGQLTGQVSPNETRTFSYDDVGRRTAWSDASGATSVAYDDAGRMTGITTPAGVVSYGYNGAGEQTTMTQPEGAVTTSYDVNGFVAEVADWRSDTITMVNDADGRMLNAERSNGVDTNYWYDDAGRLTGVDHATAAGPIDGFQYMLDGNGNRTMVTSNAGAETYTLDPLNRITDASYPGGLTEAFVYDDAGNRTSHTNTDGTTVGYTVDATGQLVSDTSGTTYTFDDAGNLMATSDGDSYVYDDYGRTTAVTSNGVTATFGYDAADVRVSVNGEAQLWDRNGGLPTLISTDTGDNYVHTAGISRDGDDWLLQDAVGSVRATVDDTGNTVGSQDFTVFGEQLTGTGSFGFAGEQQDPTGQLHLRARQYNPSLGRFTSVDPVQPGAPATTGYNLYAYSGNNPTTWTDPSGQSVLGDYAMLQFVRAQNAIAMSPATQAVLAWIAAHPLALCAGGAGIGGATYYYSGNRTWGDAGIGALEGCEAGLSIYELADVLKGPQSRPNADLPGDPEDDLPPRTRGGNGGDGDFNLSHRNDADGKIFTSDGDIDQGHFASIVHDAVDNSEDVVILTGTHGSPDGTRSPDSDFLYEDIGAFEDLPGVEVLSVDGMSDAEIFNILDDRTGVIIAAFCNSEACLDGLLPE